MIIAWNSLLQAILEREGVDYYERDPHGRVIEINDRGRVKDTAQLINLALADDKYRAVRCNLDFFLRLRNIIAHRYLPALDTSIAGEAQAMLLNLENLLVDSCPRRHVKIQFRVPFRMSGHEQAYRRLVRVYPKGFRRHYGEDLVQNFADRSSRPALRGGDHPDDPRAAR